MVSAGCVSAEVAIRRRMCLQVHHPNAVQFLGACTKQEPYILITELMPGGSMADTFRMMKVRRNASFLQKPSFPACVTISQGVTSAQWE